MWSEVSPFSFREVPRHLPSDLKIGECPLWDPSLGQGAGGVLIPGILVWNPGVGRQESTPVLCGLDRAFWIRFGLSFAFSQAEKKLLLSAQGIISVTINTPCGSGGWETSGICQD